MRVHGTRACFVFGPERGQDRANGCRCESCRRANADYARERDRASRRPDEGLEPAYVDASEAIAHIAWLRTKNIGLRTIAVRTGLGRTALQELASGRRARARQATIDKILAVGADPTGAAVVPAGRTWKMVQVLLDAGWSKARIARSLGHDRALQLSRTRVTVRNAGAVEQLSRRVDPTGWARAAGIPQLLDRQAAAEARAAYRRLERETA